MPITFPNSPTLNQKVTQAGRVFQFNGTAWDAIVAEGSDLGRVRAPQIAGGVGRPGDVLHRTADGLEWRTLPNEAVIKSLHSGMNVSNTATRISVASGHCGENDGSQIMLLSTSQNLTFNDAALDQGSREADTTYFLWQMWNINGGSGALRLSKSRTAPRAPSGQRPGRILGFVQSNTATALRPSTMTGNGLDRVIATTSPRADASQEVRFTAQSLAEVSATADMRASVPAYPFGGHPRCTLSVSVTAASSTLPEKWFMGDREFTTSAGTTTQTLADIQIPDDGMLPFGIRHAAANRINRRATFTIRTTARDFSLAVEDSR